MGFVERTVRAKADCLTTILCESCDTSFVIEETIEEVKGYNSMVPLAGIHARGAVSLKLEELIKKTRDELKALQDRWAEDKALPMVEIEMPAGVAPPVAPFLKSIPNTPCPNCGYLQSYMAYTIDNAPLAGAGCAEGLRALFVLGVAGLCPVIFFSLDLTSGSPERITDFRITGPFMVILAVYVALLALLKRTAHRRKIAAEIAETSRTHPNSAWLEERGLTVETAPPYRPPTDWACDSEIEVTQDIL